MIETEMRVLLRPESAELRFLPEGPYPLAGDRASWVAIQHGAEATTGSLNLLDLKSGENRTIALPGRPGFAFPTQREGYFVAGMERRLQLVNLATGACTPLSEEVETGVTGTVINDAVAFDQGIVFGCKDLKFAEKKAGLYFWRASDRRLFKLRNDQVCSNGKIMSRRGDRYVLLDIDTPTKTVVEYEFDAAAGKLGEPKIVIDLRDGDVYPDGMIAVPDGSSVIISMYNPADAPAGETRQYSLATGKLEAVWKSPRSPQATCPQLVRFEGQVKLIVTTAVEHMSAERQAVHVNAGSLFIGETSFTSLPETPCVTLPDSCFE